MSEFLIDRIRARARRGAKAGTLAMLAAPLAAALIGGPAWAQDAAGEKPRRGGQLQALVQPEPPVLTTAFNNSFPIGVVSTNVYEGLVSFDASQRPQPALATRWDISPDGKTVTFHLRKGVKWHDGVDFTSADVKFSVQQIWQKTHPRGRNTFAAVSSVDTPDAHTVVFHLKHPSLVIFSSLNANEGQILPRHLYEGTDIQTNPYNIKPVGTGPFKFKEWRKGQYIALERNPDYWDSGKPYVDQVIFRIIPDASSRAAALETGDVQYAPFDPVPLADVQRLRDNPELVVSTSGYDWQSAYVFMEYNLRNPVLKDLRVRQAIAHAINRQELVDVVWYGLGKPATGPVPSSLKSVYTAEGVPQYAFDPARAEKLLDEAGYKRNADGVRFVLNQEYQNFNETFKNNAEYIRQSLKRVGIDVKVHNRDLAGHLKAVYGEYAFDLNSGRWVPTMDPEVGGFRHYWSQSQAKGVPWTNASGYSSAETDRVIQAIRVEADPARRTRLFHEFQRLAQTDLPVLPLFEQRNFTVMSKKVRGLSQAPDSALASLKDVWLQP